MQAVYEAAEASGLFAENDVKVRINPYKHYKLGNTHKDFIHIFGNIMEGRSSTQKAALSRMVIEKANEILPDVSLLSMNIRDFELATYCNKSMLNPVDATND